MFVIRIVKLKKLISKIELLLELKEFWQGIFDLIRLVFTMLYLAHLMCCGFNYLGLIENSDTSWLAVFRLRDSHWTVRYLNGIYFQVVTMLTVGYGDFSGYIYAYINAYL